MKATLTFQENHYKELTDHLFQDRLTERAAYLRCGLSSSDEEQRLLVREVIIVGPGDIESATETDMVIKQRSFLRAIKECAMTDSCFVFVHSHPAGFENHSVQDDREERDLFRTAYDRIHMEQAVHGSLVFSDRNKPVGRIWTPTGQVFNISRIRVIGKRFAFYDYAEPNNIDVSVFDRQILAFGEDVQKLLGRLNVGIVGFGGTGSAVFEQLVRLGVGAVTICDPQQFEKSNINRVYGSRLSDDGTNKVEIASRLATEIGLNTKVGQIVGTVIDREVAIKMKRCDIIFGCTDDEAGRSILTRLSASYLIPVFDMGVLIDSDNGHIKSVQGRVTTLVAGSPCLFCRRVISGDVIAAEILKLKHPQEYAHRKKEGYVPELPGTAPAVIMFTSTVASTAVSELMHRLTGYLGNERNSTEVILRFDESKISTNSKVPRPGCWCTRPASWGKGDEDPYLGLTW